MIVNGRKGEVRWHVNNFLDDDSGVDIENERWFVLKNIKEAIKSFNKSKEFEEYKRDGVFVYKTFKYDDPIKLDNGWSYVYGELLHIYTEKEFNRVIKLKDL